MMKTTFFAVAALATVCALPQDPTDPAPAPADAPTPAPTSGQQQSVQIVKQQSEVNVDGYSFEFETSDGTYRQEQGEYKNDTEQEGLSVRGIYKYVAPDGMHIQVTYVADKNGYQPTEQVGDDTPQEPAQS